MGGFFCLAEVKLTQHVHKLGQAREIWHSLIFSCIFVFMMDGLIIIYKCIASTYELMLGNIGEWIFSPRVYVPNTLEALPKCFTFSLQTHLANSEETVHDAVLTSCLFVAANKQRRADITAPCLMAIQCWV